jgi:anhydro-N-acetylmuramic acid kinase
MKVIGMISGTSFDAIEAVAVNLTLENQLVTAELLGHASVPYETELRDSVARMLPPNATTIDEVCRLDTRIGQSFADVASRLGDEFFDGATDVVCSHGQTVFHWVENGHALGTLQIGQGAWIAEKTGATVVVDVRSRDVAAGGHGAPLVSLMDVLMLGTSPATIRGSLNLGGISNITVVGPNSEPIAFDIGSANALMDAAVTWLTNGAQHFDEGGEWASKGSVNDELLAQLLTDPYYAAPAPKSTGKEIFHLTYLQHHVGSRDISPNDLLATLAALTVETVARSVDEYGVVELFVAGGGTRNPVIMEGLRKRLSNVAISLIDDFGIPEDAKEAMLFALLGFLSVNGIAGTVASCTGASHASVLGAIIPGRQNIVSLAASDAPTMLVFKNKMHKA